MAPIRTNLEPHNFAPPLKSELFGLKTIQTIPPPPPPPHQLHGCVSWRIFGSSKTWGPSAPNYTQIFMNPCAPHPPP